MIVFLALWLSCTELAFVLQHVFGDPELGLMDALLNESLLWFRKHFETIHAVWVDLFTRPSGVHWRGAKDLPRTAISGVTIQPFTSSPQWSYLFVVFSDVGYIYVLLDFNLSEV